MKDKSLGIIYTIKQIGWSDMCIGRFLQQYYSSKHNYSRSEINAALRETIVDYMCNANYKDYEISRYFQNYFSSNNNDEHYRMLMFLSNIQCMYEGKWVNSMRENPFTDWEMFKDE